MDFSGTIGSLYGTVEDDSHAHILSNIDGISATTTELNKVDGFTGSSSDLNYAKDLRATGVTVGELDKLDGFTGDVTDLNYAKSLYDTGVTATEFNTVADGSTARNSHSHDERYYTETELTNSSKTLSLNDLNINGTMNADGLMQVNVDSDNGGFTINNTDDTPYNTFRIYGSHANSSQALADLELLDLIGYDKMFIFGGPNTNKLYFYWSWGGQRYQYIMTGTNVTNLNNIPEDELAK